MLVTVDDGETLIFHDGRVCPLVDEARHGALSRSRGEEPSSVYTPAEREIKTRPQRAAMDCSSRRSGLNRKTFARAELYRLCDPIRTFRLGIARIREARSRR